MEFLSELLGNRSLLPVALGLAVLAMVSIYLIIRGRKAAGLGLLAASAAAGYFVFKNERLEEAFDIEDKLAEKYDEYGDFKRRQKDRYNAVIANQEVIDALKNRLVLLKKEPERNRAEIIVIEHELNEREEMNRRLLSGEDDPITNGEHGGFVGDPGSLDIYDQRDRQDPEPHPAPPGSVADIEMNGFRLLKG